MAIGKLWLNNVHPIIMQIVNIDFFLVMLLQKIGLTITGVINSCKDRVTTYVVERNN